MGGMAIFKIGLRIIPLFFLQKREKVFFCIKIQFFFVQDKIPFFWFFSVKNSIIDGIVGGFSKSCNFLSSKMSISSSNVKRY